MTLNVGVIFEGLSVRVFRFYQIFDVVTKII